jgi:NADPH2:quinone reductase
VTHAVRIHAFGGPEVLQWETVELPNPGPTEVRVRHTAIGLNFIDIYERTGLYPTTLPTIPGREAAGVIEAVGERVKGLAVGDRVAYTSQSAGAYCEVRVISAEHLVRIPDGIDDRTAAAMMLKGLTAQALLRQIYRVRKNDFIVLHAAAGGVGLIALQWAKHLGANVIAIVGTEEKAAMVRARRADHVLLATEDWRARVKQITRGEGAHVVYDSIGKDTFMTSLDCVRPRGLMVTYGNASGPVPPVAPLELSKRGSLFLTRPTLFHYIATRPALTKAAQELFDLVARSVIDIHIGQTYPLSEVARAHRDLEARRTTGSTVLLP